MARPLLPGNSALIRVKKNRVSYSIPHPAQLNAGHCFGVNAVALDDVNNVLYSAGRDSTIKSWKLDPSKKNEFTASPELLHSYEHHSDWVNDIVLLEGDKLMSCSSDSTVKLWRTDPELSHRLLHTWTWHHDYVKALKWSAVHGYAASVGLDGCAYVWDPSELDASSPHNSATQYSAKSRASLWSLALADAAPLLATAGTDSVIRVWDTRSGDKCAKLKGHSDNVRALVFSEDGRCVISGSSDGQVKVWDLSMHKCLHTYLMHEDSVWTLALHRAHLYSAGRDRHVFRTHLATHQSTLIGVETAHVLSLAPQSLGDSDARLWVSTTQGMALWDPRDSESSGTASHRMVLLATSPSAFAMTSDAQNNTNTASNDNALLVEDGEMTRESLVPLRAGPVWSQGGRPGLIRHHLLSNRRHVITQDSAGTIQLWDITRGVCERDLQCESGERSFEEWIKELDVQTSIPNWYSVDTRTGALTLHLDFPQCFSAEVYASDAGLAVNYPPGDKEHDEPVVNLGQHTLKALFTHWLTGYKASTSDESDGKQEANNRPEPRDDSPAPRDTSQSGTSATEASQSTTFSARLGPGVVVGTARSDASSTSRDESDSSEESDADLEPVVAPFTLPAQGHVMITEEGTGRLLFRAPIGELTGRERMIPTWVLDCLLLNKVPSRTNSKISFFLTCKDDKISVGLKSRFSTLRIMKIKKIKEYLVKDKLGLELPKHCSDESRTCTAEEYLTICCHDKELDNNVNLATVKTYYWKSSEDMMLSFKISADYANSPVKKKKL
jgi:WD repeat-containing protein 48